MDRRAFVFATLALAAAPSPEAVRAAAQIELVYVGGWDCPYCTQWKNQSKAAWLVSPEYRHVKYVEVDSPKLREAYDKRFWPGELGAVLDQLPRKSGTPRFLIVRDGKVLSNEYGTTGWPTTLGRLRKLLG